MVVVSPAQTITCAISLVSLVIGERLATTLSDGNMHPAGLADTQLLAVECMDQVTAGFKHALRVACPLVEQGPATRWQEPSRPQVCSHRL